MFSENGFVKKQNGKRVLVVDSVHSIGTQSVGELYETILRLDGYIIDTAATVQEALTLLESNQPDLIITTSELFNVDNHNSNAFSELKSVSPHTPILAIIAQKNTDLQYAHNIAEQLHLPFKIAELRASVTRLLEMNTKQDSRKLFNSSVHSEPKYSESPRKDNYS